MSTSRTNDVRIQFVIDSRIIAILEKYFNQQNIPVHSVSDLVRKSLRTLAFSVSDLSSIPTKEEAKQIISSLAQHGSGFGSDYNNLKVTPFHSRVDLTDTDEDKINQFLTKFPKMTRPQAIEMMIAARKVNP